MKVDIDQFMNTLKSFGFVDGFVDDLKLGKPSKFDFVELVKNKIEELKKEQDNIKSKSNVIVDGDVIKFIIPGYYKNEISVKLIKGETNTVTVYCDNVEFGILILEQNIGDKEIKDAKLVNGIMYIYTEDKTKDETEFDIDFDVEF